MPVPLVFPNLASLLPGPDVAVRKPEPFTFMSQMSPFLKAAVDTTQKVVSEVRSAKDHQAELDSYAKFFDEQGNPEIANLLRSQKELIKPNISGAIYGESAISKSRSNMLNGILSFAKGQQAMDLAERRTSAYEAKQKAQFDFSKGFSQATRIADEYAQQADIALKELEGAEASGNTVARDAARQKYNNAIKNRDAAVREADRIRNDYSKLDTPTPGSVPNIQSPLSAPPKAKPINDGDVVPANDGDVVPAPSAPLNNAPMLNALPGASTQSPPVVIHQGRMEPQLPIGDGGGVSSELLTPPTPGTTTPAAPAPSVVTESAPTPIPPGSSEPRTDINVPGLAQPDGRPTVDTSKPASDNFEATFSSWGAVSNSIKNSDQELSKYKGNTTKGGREAYESKKMAYSVYKPQLLKSAKSAYEIASDISKNAKILESNGQNPLTNENEIRRANDEINSIGQIVNSVELDSTSFNSIRKELSDLQGRLSVIERQQRLSIKDPTLEVEGTSTGGVTLSKPFVPRSSSAPKYITYMDGGKEKTFKVPNESDPYVLRVRKGQGGTFDYYLVNTNTNEEKGIVSIAEEANTANRSNNSLYEEWRNLSESIGAAMSPLAKSFKNYLANVENNVNVNDNGESVDPAMIDEKKKKIEADLQEALKTQ